MDFFGLTLYGPQNYIRDVLRDDYVEPLNEEESRSLLTSVSENSTCPKNVERPSIDVIRLIDCYMGRVNGFPYGSIERLDKMKRKGVIKPVGPQDMYRFAPTTSAEVKLQHTHLRIIDIFTLTGVGGLNYREHQKASSPVIFYDVLDVLFRPPTPCGWWLCDSALTDATWTKTCPRFPQPMSPNTKILDTVRKNDKYATFF